MKKILIVFAAATFIISCGDNNADTTSGTANDAGASTSTAAPGAATDPGNASTSGQVASADADKGLELIAQSDCLTCHKVEDKVVGPAYRDVAKKYANTPEMIDSLASKIIHGGAGNWGPTPMTPHATLAKEDAKTMVKYIMSLKQ